MPADGSACRLPVSYIVASDHMSATRVDTNATFFGVAGYQTAGTRREFVSRFFSPQAGKSGQWHDACNGF